MAVSIFTGALAILAGLTPCVGSVNSRLPVAGLVAAGPGSRQFGDGLFLGVCDWHGHDERGTPAWLVALITNRISDF